MELDILGITLRWLHIMGAITLFGGLIFRAVALGPACKELPEAERESFCEAVRRRWAKVVGISALILIATGATNLVMIIREYGVVRGASDKLSAFGGYEAEMALRLPDWYKYILYTKVGLALIIFFLASLLFGKGKLAQKMRPAAGKWVCLTAVLATILVAMSAVARSTHTGPSIGTVMEVFIDEDPAPEFDPNAATSTDDTTDTTETAAPEEAPTDLDFTIPDAGTE